MSNPEMCDFAGSCTSYMLCKKYNIDVTNFNLSSIPSCLKDMSGQEIREKLTIIRDSMENINSRMSVHLESISRNQNGKDRER